MDNDRTDDSFALAQPQVTNLTPAMIAEPTRRGGALHHDAAFVLHRLTGRGCAWGRWLIYHLYERRLTDQVRNYVHLNLVRDN